MRGCMCVSCSFLPEHLDGPWSACVLHRHASLLRSWTFPCFKLPLCLVGLDSSVSVQVGWVHLVLQSRQAYAHAAMPCTIACVIHAVCMHTSFCSNTRLVAQSPNMLAHAVCAPTQIWCVHMRVLQLKHARMPPPLPMGPPPLSTPGMPGWECLGESAFSTPGMPE